MRMILRYGHHETFTLMTLIKSKQHGSIKGGGGGVGGGGGNDMAGGGRCLDSLCVRLK
ncbi:hypothetical protein G9A89_006198 [Geosiphon pyriformis]|nr:hypothetical protein G9A89_006198 [Geosiphon pyriformis]